MWCQLTTHTTHLLTTKEWQLSPRGRQTHDSCFWPPCDAPASQYAMALLLQLCCGGYFCYIKVTIFDDPPRCHVLTAATKSFIWCWHIGLPGRRIHWWTCRFFGGEWCVCVCVCVCACVVQSQCAQLLPQCSNSNASLQQWFISIRRVVRSRQSC